ncbi:MAG: ATP-dependent helicase RecG, ATP-dependent helicase RecG [Candidatus Parcubacteria bacterium]|jgi:ATP-dependent DNA helicase RecG
MSLSPFLSQPVKSFFRLSDVQNQALKKLGISTINDILYHFPVRYGESNPGKLIRDIVGGEQVTIYGKVTGLKMGKSFKSHAPKAEGYIEDDSGRVKVIWLHQPYIARLIQNESLVKVSGKVSDRNGVLGFMNPEIESIGALPINIGESLFGESVQHGSMPIYSESKGITSRWFFHALQKVFKHPDFESVVDPIPEEILARYNLPSLRTSLIWIHAPQKESDAQVARKRFAFEEVFFIQLANEQRRHENSIHKGFIIDKPIADVDVFTKRFPFPLTDGQQKSINDILADFKKGQPMSRLLEGDVGSGKTAVAAVTAYTAVTTRPKNQGYGTLQVAYMAPTEILAKQHFESFIKYFSHLPISIGLITGTGCRKFPSKLKPGGWTDISRSQFLKWVANGEIAVVIGTHALIQKAVKFKHLSYVIIDEQHRFGTAQRQKLARKQDIIPHLLSMTATPIPRTLALTMYGDLDLSLLDQMPMGRKPVITEIVAPAKRDAVYEKIHKELKEGRQVYIICPRIDEPDPEKEKAINAKSVKEEAKRLKKDIFKDYKIDIMHSKMKPAEKDDVMEKFSNHNVDILVSTSVVEVGVNVPNATVIIIEGGERFGLSQLHQLRGRVIRGNHQAYCYVFTESQSDKTIDRLKALATAKNGFELSEIDLQLRGAGELYGGKQWGISDVAMEAIKNIKMVEAARKESRAMIESDPTLSQYPLIKQTLEGREEIHFE